MCQDCLQPKDVTNGYFEQAEELKDFVDYLFDIEKVANYDEAYNRFLEWEKKQLDNKNQTT